MRWTEASFTNGQPPPSPRSGHSATVVNGGEDVVVFGGEKPSREEEGRRRCRRCRPPRRVAGEVVVVVLRLGVLLGERCVDNTIFVVVVVVRSKSRESRHRSSGKRPELRNKDGVFEREREKVR